MAVIDFKSVGERTDNPRLQNTTQNEIPIGIKTPFRIGSGNEGIFAMHFSLEDQIQDNFRNLLQTNKGERLGRYNFGANLKELSFERGQSNFDVEAIQRIRGAISQYMSFIEPRTFESNVDSRESQNGLVKVRIAITYDVPRIGINSKRIEVTLVVGG